MHEFELLDPVDADGNLDGVMRAAQKQASRDRDAAALKSGATTMADLRLKNGFFAGVDFSKLRIGAVGDVPYDKLG
jgi:hypothetical protein